MVKSWQSAVVLTSTAAVTEVQLWPQLETTACGSGTRALAVPTGRQSDLETVESSEAEEGVAVAVAVSVAVTVSVAVAVAVDW
jgi:hypothetical protein